MIYCKLYVIACTDKNVFEASLRPRLLANTDEVCQVFRCSMKLRRLKMEQNFHDQDFKKFGRGGFSLII